MPEICRPTIIFDVAIGKSLIEQIDVDEDEITALLREKGLSDEAINETVITFQADPKENPSDDNEWAEANFRKIIFYLGSYVLQVLKETSDHERASLLTTLVLSEGMAHEIEHVRQFEAGELPYVPIDQISLPHPERPWEIQANQAGEAYIHDYRQHKRRLTVTVLFIEKLLSS